LLVAQANNNPTLGKAIASLARLVAPMIKVVLVTVHYAGLDTIKTELGKLLASPAPPAPPSPPLAPFLPPNASTVPPAPMPTPPAPTLAPNALQTPGRPQGQPVLPTASLPAPPTPPQPSPPSPTRPVSTAVVHSLAIHATSSVLKAININPPQTHQPCLAKTTAARLNGLSHPTQTKFASLILVMNLGIPPCITIL
jgi:hypothetical protein